MWRCKSLGHKGLHVVSLSNRNSRNILPSEASLVYGPMATSHPAPPGGRVMQNKANDGPEGLGIVECGLRIEEQETVTANLQWQVRQTKPICPARRVVCTAHPAERQTIRRTKQSQTWEKWDTRGSSQSPSDACDIELIMPNKANLSCRTGTSGDARPTARNKANFRGADWRLEAGGNCRRRVKQSQFAWGQVDDNCCCGKEL